MLAQKASLAPLPLPVSTISLGHTVSEMSRSYATAFQARELCLEQGYVRYGAYAIGNKLLRMFLQGASRPSLTLPRQPD